MSAAFHIRYSWAGRAIPRELPERYMAGWPPLYQGLQRFLARYEGEFALQFDQRELILDLHPDLPMVFELLPSLLERLLADTGAAVELYFGEQGTDLLLELQRRAALIELGFVAGPSVGRRFAPFIGTCLTVDARAFLAEWLGFLRALLGAMVALEIQLSASADYRQYIARLDAIADAAQ